MRWRCLVPLVLTAGHVAADNTMLLRPDDGGWRSGGHRDVVVLASSEGRPLGAVRFDIVVTDTQTVRCVAVFGDRVAAAGGLIPLCDDAAMSASGVTRVAAFNAWRPDAPWGTSRVATLRFRVTGEPGDSCLIIVTNIALWSTAALPTNETEASAPCRELPVSLTSLALPVVVSGAAGHRLDLAAVPSSPRQGALYPIRLTADSRGELLAAFDATLTWPTGAVEILDVSTLDRRRMITWYRDGNRLRLLGLQGADLTQPRGMLDLATLWLALRDTPVTAEERLELSEGRLLTGPAAESAPLTVSNSVYAIHRMPPVQQAFLTAPPPTHIVVGGEFVTALSLDPGTWTPWLVGGRFLFDPARLQVLAVHPTGLLAGAAFTVDTNTFTSGCVPFTWSDFSAGDRATNDVLDLLTVCWRVTGATLESGVVRGELFLADGIWNGWDTAAPVTHLPFRIRFSPTDMDGDGIPDWWAIQYYGGETNVGAGSDTDLDGMTAWDEYVARTDPTNRLSRLEMLAICRAGPDVSVAWSSVTGVVYRLRRSTNLLETFGTVVADGIEVAAPTHTFTDTNAPLVPQLFYRVTVPTP